MNNNIDFYTLKGTASVSLGFSMQIARDIGQQIVSNQYKVGESIGDENKLAVFYRVSRAVVRDAIKILNGKGIVESRRGVGTQVLPRSNWAMLDSDILAWHQAIEPNVDLMWQFLDVRKVFEPKAAYWAAERASDTQLTQIKTAFEDMQNELNPKNFIMADAEFHRLILRATGNDFMIAFEGVIFSALLLSLRLTNKTKDLNKESLPLHKSVSDAILLGDKNLAERKMKQLLSDVEIRLNAYFDK